MNFSNPILVYSHNEQFRLLIRDMLMKNGFFHIVESATETETVNYLNLKKDYVILIDSKILTPHIQKLLNKQKDFLVFSDKADELTGALAAKIGTGKILCYPLHSRKLMDKIGQIL